MIHSTTINPHSIDFVKYRMQEYKTLLAENNDLTLKVSSLRIGTHLSHEVVLIEVTRRVIAMMISIVGFK